MWMLGYDDGGEFNLPADSFNRKLRPLIPRTNHQPPCLSRFSGTELFSLNNHFSPAGDQSKRTDFNLQQPVMMSSRWNPTPEQLRTLEELYRRGTRTPSADQIQHITAQLRRYGKIEGKNVFYWFQNHKARERLKRRRQMESAADEHHRDAEILERKDSGANRTTDDAEQTKNWALPTSIISNHAEELVPIQAAAKGTVAGGRAGQGWIQFERAELNDLQQERSFVERNATWQKMQLPSSTATTRARVDHSQHIPAHEGGPNIFLSGPNKNGTGCSFSHVIDLRNVRGKGGGGEDGCRESQTLELFPLGGNGRDDCRGHEKAAETASGMNMDNSLATACQYFEFLPLKN